MRIHIMTSRISRGSHELTYFHQPALPLIFFMLGAHFCSKSSKVKAPNKLLPEAPLPSLFSSFKKVQQVRSVIHSSILFALCIVCFVVLFIQNRPVQMAFFILFAWRPRLSVCIMYDCSHCLAILLKG